MNTHRILLTVTSLFLLPIAAYAGEYDSFLRELDALDTQITQQQVAQERLEFTRDYEVNSEVFPRGAKYEKPITGYRTESVSDTHIFTRVGDTPIILTDVPVEAWFAPYVRDMSGIISGYSSSAGEPLGLFGPADNVTLSMQLVKINQVAQSNPLI
jgi:hypothetical protein